ncbi:MAG: hypothetical protein ACYCPP_06735 [Nitrososphaerales archaeon]
MGVKRKVQTATTKVTSRLKQMGFARRLSNPGSTDSLATRGIEWVYLIVLFLLMAGIINAIGNAGTAGIDLQTIVPNASIQNMTETFIMLFGYIVGALGAYALYLSGRQTIRARSAEMFFVGGIALIAVAMTLGYYIINAKGG